MAILNSLKYLFINSTYFRYMPLIFSTAGSSEAISPSRIIGGTLQLLKHVIKIVNLSFVKSA